MHFLHIIIRTALFTFSLSLFQKGHSSLTSFPRLAGFAGTINFEHPLIAINPKVK